MRPVVSISGAGSAIQVLLALGLCLSLARFAWCAVEPLDVPRGTGPTPESHAQLPAAERIEQGVRGRSERGYVQYPMLALALLQVAERDGRPDLAERALELAPHSPGVHMEAALRHGKPLRWLTALPASLQSFPALTWILALVGAVLGVAVCVGAVLTASFGVARTLPLSGHSVAHLLGLGSAAAAPAGLAVLSALVCLPLAGLGVGVVAAAAGALVTLRGTRAMAFACTGLTFASGLIIGPGLEHWAPLASTSAGAPALAAAWRVEFAEPLPGDLELLQAQVARQPDDPFYVLSLASAHKHLGDLARAQTLLDTIPKTVEPVLGARVANLRGIVTLARADILGALAEFERARAYRETAAIVYNMSQVHARNVELRRREDLYNQAQRLDPDLVSQYASLEGANVHRYVIQEPLSLGFYLARALEPNAEAGALRDSLRAVWIGTLPFGWALLCVLALVSLVARQVIGPAALGRCKRCDRVVCRKCTPGARVSTCESCDGLYGGAGKITRVRRALSDGDRLRQTLLRYRPVVSDLVLPGLGALIEERGARAATRFVLLGAAVGLAVAARAIPVPFEIEQAASWPLWCAATLAGWLYLVELWRARVLLRGGSRT